MRPVVFLPGILMPAPLRYAALLAVLGPDVPAHTKELEVYRGTTTPPTGYSLDAELDGLDRFIDGLTAEAVHLYGHSGGGAVALAYAARAPERVLTLALDEPATDFSDEDRAEVAAAVAFREDAADADLLGTFVRALIRSDLDPPPPPEGPPPPWMANRPDGIRAFVAALDDARVDHGVLRSLRAPVYYSVGDHSNERWLRIRDRLAATIPDFTAEVYEGLSHLNTSHIAEPERVAAALRALWARAEG